MDDDLLRSLTVQNLYLQMLNEFRADEQAKETRKDCRPVHLHAAFENKFLGFVLVVPQDSAVLPIGRLASSPILGFDLDHSAIAKPDGVEHLVSRWVRDTVRSEYLRLDEWDQTHRSLPQNFRLCKEEKFLPE